MTQLGQTRGLRGPQPRARPLADAVLAGDDGGGRSRRGQQGVDRVLQNGERRGGASPPAEHCPQADPADPCDGLRRTSRLNEDSSGNGKVGSRAGLSRKFVTSQANYPSPSLRPSLRGGHPARDPVGNVSQRLVQAPVPHLALPTHRLGRSDLTLVARSDRAGHPGLRDGRSGHVGRLWVAGAIPVTAQAARTVAEARRQGRPEAVAQRCAAPLTLRAAVLSSGPAGPRRRRRFHRAVARLARP
jgi:hypothetical protein